MDVRSICPYLRQRCLSAIDIRTDSDGALGIDTIGHSTVTKSLQEAQIGRDSESTQISIEAKGQVFVGEAIHKALAGGPLASIRRMVSEALIPRSTVHRHLGGPFPWL
jgi:hypothetical protein